MPWAAAGRGLHVDEANDVPECAARDRAVRTAVFVPEGKSMLHYALVFLIVAIIAAILGFGGIAGTAAGIAKILFVVFLVLAIVSFVRRAK